MRGRETYGRRLPTLGRPWRNLPKTTEAVGLYGDDGGRRSADSSPEIEADWAHIAEKRRTASGWWRCPSFEKW